MTYDEAQGAAAFTTVEILCRLLVRSGSISKGEFDIEMERYAKMHEGTGIGARSPHDPEVARLLRILVRGAALP